MEKKQTASTFFNGEMESEQRDLGNLDFFGLLKTDGDRGRVMEQIDVILFRGVTEVLKTNKLT